MSSPSSHINTIDMNKFLNNINYLTVLPSYQEYDQRLVKFQSAISNYESEINLLAKERAGNNLTAQRNKNFAWGAAQAKVRTDKINNHESKIQELKIARDNYMKAVVDNRRIKNTEQIEQSIRDTIRKETEKFREELKTIPKDEPLQILNETQHIQPQIIEPLQILNETQHIQPQIIETPIQEKSFIDKNKNYLIIGGVGIFAVILILAVRK